MMDVDPSDETYQALTSREESDLEMLMEKCEFSINNANAFTEQLSRELMLMDAANIQSIVASEQRVEGLMQLMQTSVDEITKLEQRMENYETLLKNVRDVVLQVEQKESLIQTQNDNNKKLLLAMEMLVVELNFSRENEVQLLEGDLNSVAGISACIGVATALQDAMNADIHQSLNHMNCVQEQKENLTKIRSKFVARVYRHLNTLFDTLVNDSGDSLMSSINCKELTLPTHEVIHSQLMKYLPLMKWIKMNDKSTFNTLTQKYINTMKHQYRRELSHFFEIVKEKLSGNRFTVTSVDSSEMKRRGPPDGHSRGRASSLSGNANELLDSSSSRGSEISLSEWEEFDNCIERLLSAIDPVCLSEQQFCQEFFIVDMNAPVQLMNQSPHSVSPSPSNLSQNSNDNMDLKKSDQLRQIMIEQFSILETEFENFAYFYDKLDGLYSMYLLVRLTQHVLSAQDTGSFLAKAYGNIVIKVKRNFDSFMTGQYNAIEEAKAPKRPKCGVMQFIKKFEQFAKQAESVFKASASRRADIDRWYIKLVRAIFEAIGRISMEHHKTPSEMVRIENYHYVHNMLCTLKIQCLDAERKESKQRYNDAVKDYVSRYFGRPLEKLNVFFEGVQQKVAQGVKEQEIGYQMAYSKQELRKVIKDCGLKEVKRGLEEMYRRVEKHACEPDSTLIQVIWRSMQEEFISQHKAIQEMIERCYPDANLTLSFTIDDILSVFSDIAQSH